MKNEQMFDLTPLERARDAAAAAGCYDEQNLYIDGFASYAWEAPEPGVDF